MMDKSKVPKKNVRPVLADIRHPRKIFNSGEKEKPLDWGIGTSRKIKFIKRTFIFSLLVILLGGIFLSFQLFNLKRELSASGKTIYDSLKQIADSFTNLETESASNSLSSVNSQIKSIDEQFKFFSLLPILREIPETFGKLQELTDILKSVNNNLIRVETGGVGLFFGEGDGVLPILRDTEENLKSLDDLSIDLRNRLAKFGELPEDFDSNYLALTTNLSRLREGFGAIINLFGASQDKHLLVIFENPSEIRPSGGFVGSYADISLYQGKIQDIDVNDIYYPDRFLKLKLTPPLQLQGTTVDWGARDVNWFFDFPTSARKLIDFIETSSVYSERSIKFEGVIGINVRVIEDLLKITGPIELKQYKLTLDENNFLKQVQYEVESGVDKKPGQNPKRILKAITPILIERLKGLDEGEKKEFLQVIGYRLNNKDIKVYFKDKTLENFATGLGVGGEIFSIPMRFSGDYLAIVNANIAGGKSDAFIKETITLNSKIESDGTLTNSLRVVREHKGRNEKESWYRATNQNFIKIFTPLDSRLELMTGNSSKVIKPKIDYKKAGYAVDADLKSIEDTREVLEKYNAESYKEFGKKVFATWLNVSAGSSKGLSVSYDEQTRINLSDGAKFQFVLDKQSGVESGFQYSVEAPPGFRFGEANAPIFHYESDQLPGRLIIDLTLKANGS